MQSLKSPFKFLAAYEKGDYKQFSGRDREIEDLYNLIFKSNITLLFGVMGVGKTSLIRCGLANRFLDSQWLPLNIRKGKNIMDSLINEIQKAYLKIRPIDAENNASKYLKGLYGDKFKKIESPQNTNIPQEFPQDPIEALKTLYLESFTPIYLIFDQFEEIFTIGEELERKNEQIDFFTFLKKLSDSGLAVKTILVMREEYFANLDHYNYILPHLTQNRIRVEKMNFSTLKEVVKRVIKTSNPPIQMSDETIPKEIVNKLTKNETKEIELTYLQVYLDRLYQEAYKLKGEPVIFNQEVIDKVKDLENVLEGFLDTQVEGFNSEEERQLAWKVLKELITENGTKKSMLLIDLIENLNKKL